MIAVQHSAKDDRIYFKQARSLAQAGFELHILTANDRGIPCDMSGKTAISPDELGIHFHCIKTPNDFFNKALKKLFLGRFYATMIAKASELKADLYVAHEPQSILIARKAAEKNESSYHFDSHESLFFNNWKDRYALKYEMNKLSSFSTANEYTEQTLAEMNPRAAHITLWNGSILSRNLAPNPEERLIVHEGSLPFNRGLKLMLESLSILKNKQVEFKLRIVGSLKGEEKIYFQDFINQHELAEHIALTGWVPYEDLEKHLEQGAIGLILNTDTPNNIYGGPANKLFNYIARGFMVISVDLPETKKILSTSGAGIILEQRDPIELAQVLERALNDEAWRMGYRIAASNASASLSWEEESKKMVAFFQELLSD